MSNFRSSRSWDDMQVTISLARVPAVNAPNWTTFDFGIGGGVAFAVLGFGVNAAFAAPAGSPYSAEVTLGAAEAGYHRILELADIPASNTTVSSIYNAA